MTNVGYRLAPELTDAERRMCRCGHLAEEHNGGACQNFCGCDAFDWGGTTLRPCGHLPGDCNCLWVQPATLGRLVKPRDRPRRHPLPFRKVWDRDGWQCTTCGTHKNLTVDHIIPVSKGGTDDLGNLQTMCGSCNSRKGNRT